MRVEIACVDWVLKAGEDELRFHEPAVYQPAVATGASSPSSSVAAISDRRILTAITEQRTASNCPIALKVNILIFFALGQNIHRIETFLK